jgi:hypothetical protein
MVVCQNPGTPVVHIKIAGKWMFIPLKMVLIGIDPYPNHVRLLLITDCLILWIWLLGDMVQSFMGDKKFIKPSLNGGEWFLQFDNQNYPTGMVVDGLFSSILTYVG